MRVVCVRHLDRANRGEVFGAERERRTAVHPMFRMDELAVERANRVWNEQQV
jgi:hypothetical protein